jgi:phosphoglycerate dehydrogenase-like enzyme
MASLHVKLLIALYHPFPLWTAPDWLAPRLRADFPEIAVTQLPGPRYEGIDREITDADVCIAWSIRPEQFAHAKRLRWVHSPAAAVHQLMFPEMVASDVIVTNAREVHGPVVAEHAIAVVLALAKRLPSAMLYQRARTWGQQAMWTEDPTICEVNGAKVVLIGLGSIGREFAKRARALGMRVIAVREHPERGAETADEVVGTEQLHRVLPDADFVVLAAPLTSATRNIVDQERLGQMKDSAYLVNVSRGPLIDDEALVNALESDEIAGAALDVFAEEPLPPASRYWDLPNVLITPHTAAITPKLWERHYRQISLNLRRFLAEEPLEGIVGKEKGY